MTFTDITTPSGTVTIDPTDGYMTSTPNSEAVTRWSFFPKYESLHVTWGDKNYIYSGVPFIVVARLLATDSVGRFLNAEVKPNYEVTKVDWR